MLFNKLCLDMYSILMELFTKSPEYYHMEGNCQQEHKIIPSGVYSEQKIE